MTITRAESHRTGDNYSLSGEANFYNTVSFGSFLALRDGVVIPDVTIISANGATYTPAVPEPCSLLLLGSGLGVIGFTAWRRKK